MIYLDQSPNLYIRVSYDGDHFGLLMGQGNKPRLFEGIQKQKIGHQCKSDWVVKRGQEKNPTEKACLVCLYL